MMIWLGLVATLTSILFLILSGWGDPKRTRSAGLRGGDNPSRRHFYVLGAVAPGVLILFTGDASIWLIWFGGAAVGGWLVALYLARRGPRVRGQ